MAVAIFIDLAGSSRDPRRRAKLQRLLLRLRDRLNVDAGSRLIAPFEVVWGDELKGVLADPRDVWNLYRATYELMAGVPFYFSIGFGTIDTGDVFEETGDINLLDGTAFKAAREAMVFLKAKAKEIQPYRIHAASAGSPNYVAALNAYFGVLNDLVQHMTTAQRQHLLRAFPWNGESELPPDAASRQSIWETLQRARIDAYREANRGIEALLQLAVEYDALIVPREVS